MKHILSMSPDYVKGWDEWDAARELIQNATDQAEQVNAKPIVEWREGKLRIGVKGAELLPKTLLLGVTTKADDKSQRGQFGEGYKLAMLVLARNLYGVRVLTGSEEWTATIVRSDEYGVEVLQVERKPIAGLHANGVFFLIDGIAEPTWKTIESRYLPGIKHDEILPDKPGMMFSGGLFLCNAKGMRFGYNFSPRRLAVGRDRNIVAGFDLDWATAQIWAKTKRPIAELYGLMKEDARDARFVAATEALPAKAAEVIAVKFEEDFGEGTAPVEDQTELDRARGQGLRAHIIPECLRKTVKRVR